MHLAILHNADHDLLEDDPGREAREDVTRVAGALAQALAGTGFRIDVVPVGEEPLQAIEKIARRRPELVLNLCESIGADSRGEMAVPVLLDLFGVPYTGSGALALGLALHKNKAKEMLRARGVPTPKAALVSSVADVARIDLPFPLIVKPTREDASVGIDFDSVVNDQISLARAVARVIDELEQPALVEQYIAGREIYVPLLGNQPRTNLPLTEVQFGAAFENRPKIISYKAKWETESAEFRDSTPKAAALEPELEARIVAAAQSAFEALDCRDYGRVDLRLSADGQPYVIDVNPNCDLHPEAGFAKAARSIGIEYPALALRLVEIALARHHANPPHRLAGSRAARRAAAPDRELHAGRGDLRARAH
jgi:D-alanine-D-alanine ligase